MTFFGKIKWLLIFAVAILFVVFIGRSIGATNKNTTAQSQTNNSLSPKDSVFSTTTESLASNTFPKEKYTLTQNHVYFNDFFAGAHLIENADKATFEILKPMKMDCGSPAYAHDKNHVFFDDKVLEGADTMTFEVLASPYSKDRYHVYVDGKPLRGVDPQSFRVVTEKPSRHSCDESSVALFARDARHWIHADIVDLNIDPDSLVFFNNTFFKDKNGLYYFTIGDYAYKKIDAADPVTFVALSDSFAKDKSHVYQYALGMEYEEFKTLPMDPATFVLVGSDNTYYHVYKDKDHVFYGPYNWEIKGADVPTFVLFVTATNTIFYKDKNKVYRTLNGRHGAWSIDPIEGSDPSTFTILQTENHNTYSKDASSVFFNAQKISGADPKSFKSIPKIYGLSADSAHVFIENEMMKNLDPNTLRIYDFYLTDFNGVYILEQDNLGGNPVRITLLHGVSPVTFRVLSAGYAVDNTAVYYRGNKIINADVATFHTLGDGVSEGYAKDNTTLYFEGVPIKPHFPVDVATFEVLSQYFARDKNHVIFNIGASNQVGGIFGIIMEADPATFSVPLDGEGSTTGSLYGIDVSHVYYYDKVVPGADPKTFHLNGGYYGKDATSVYYNGRVVVLADPLTFFVHQNNSSRAQDKNYIYTEGQAERPTDEAIWARNP